MTTRFRFMRAFLWIAVLAWGIGAGAKLYDLIVVASAWSASPPESLSLMPYGARFPVGPGQFLHPHRVRHSSVPQALSSADGALRLGIESGYGHPPSSSLGCSYLRSSLFGRAIMRFLPLRLRRRSLRQLMLSSLDTRTSGSRLIGTA